MEQWKDIAEFSGLYRVSSTGQVQEKARDGTWGVLLHETPTKHGMSVCLKDLSGKTHGRLVHRLVAEAFIPNPDDHRHVSHKDRDKSNNKVDNLEWIGGPRPEPYTYKFSRQQLKEERWRVCPLAPSYEASTLGRVRRELDGRLVQPFFDPSNYLRVGLSVARGKSKGFLMHRVIAMTWIPNEDEKKTINHKNHVRHDNRVVNLEWMTDSENIRHSYTNPLRGRGGAEGENNMRAVFTEKDVRRIRRMYASGRHNMCELAEEYKTSKENISQIVNRVTWKHVPDELDGKWHPAEQRKRRPKSTLQKLTREQADAIRVAYAAGGETHETLAVKYGVTTASIYAVVNNKSHVKGRDQKLTPEQREEIKACSGTLQAIADEYGVTKQTVWRLKSDTPRKSRTRKRVAVET